MLTRLLFFGLLSHAIALFIPQTSNGLNLDETVALALENNPDFQKQQMNQSANDENLKGLKSSIYGKIEFLASYGHYNLPRTLAPLTPSSIFLDPTAVPTTVDLFGTGIMYELPLFTGFAQQSSVEIAVLEKQMAGAALKLSREQLIYNAKSLYINILAQQAMEGAQKQYHSTLQKLYDDISLEVKLGKKARVERLKAAADLENAKVQAQQINGNIRILKTTLANLLSKETIDNLEEISITVPTSGEIDYTKKIEDLERYRSAVLDVIKKTKLVDKSGAAYYPQIVFNGFYGQNFGPNDDSNRDEGDWNNQEVWQATVNLKWTVFDFGGRKSSQQMAAIRRQQSQRERLKTELDLKKSLSEAEIKIQLAIDAFHSAEAECALTRETEIIEKTRFDKGAADVNDLLYVKARNQLALSRSISAKYNYLSSCFYLDYLLENGENK
jgi:outer membrane protein TolC